MFKYLLGSTSFKKECFLSGIAEITLPCLKVFVLSVQRAAKLYILICLFQWISSFRSICQIYALWVPISAVEGPHLVPISLKIGSPLGPHFDKIRSPLHVASVRDVPTHLRCVMECVVLTWFSCCCFSLQRKWGTHVMYMEIFRPMRAYLGFRKNGGSNIS